MTMKIKPKLRIIGFALLLVSIVGVAVVETDVRTLKEVHQMDKVDLRPELIGHHNVEDMHNDLVWIGASTLIATGCLGIVQLLEAEDLDISIKIRDKFMEED